MTSLRNTLQGLLSTSGVCGRMRRCGCENVSSVLTNPSPSALKQLSDFPCCWTSSARSVDWRQISVSQRPSYKRAKSCFYFLNRAESLHPLRTYIYGRKGSLESGRWNIKETSLRSVRKLNQGQNNNCRELKGVKSWTADHTEHSSSRHILIHNNISHFASSPAVFHCSYLERAIRLSSYITVSFSFRPSCFLCSSFFITPMAASQSRRGDFIKVLTISASSSGGGVYT